MGEKITISDVAQALNVSKTTVSRAISGKGRVGADTRKRVISYIKEYGYVPNAIAQSLANSKTYNLGLVVPKDYAYNDMPFFKECMAGICEYASGNDYDVVVTMTTTEDISQLERMVNNKKVDGVILSRTLTDDPCVKLLKKANIPFVTVGSCKDAEVIQIDSDHEAACSMLTKLLLEQGIKKIALIGGDMSHIVTNSRLKGFLKAMTKAGITGAENMVYGDVSRLSLGKTVDGIIKSGYECILCMDDSVCVKVLDYLKQQKKEIPKDIKVASFYDSRILERNVPSITALKYDAAKLGETAAKRLMEAINRVEAPKKILLGYEVSMRESTKI